MLISPSGGRVVASGPAAAVGNGQPYPAALEHVGTVVAVPAEADGLVCSVAFDAPYSGSTVVLLTPANAAAVSAGLYVTSSSNDFTVHAVTAEPGTAVIFHYQVIGVAE